MRLWKFDSYEKYKKAQIRGSNWRPGRHATADKHELNRIAEYLNRQGFSANSVLCHGARCGTEVVLFKEKYPDAAVIGTDLAPRADTVIYWDFNEQKPEWVGAMDIVYSNSLDHSPEPEKTLKTWLAQLKPTGKLILQWNCGHAKIVTWEKLYHGGDCFGTHLEEFITLLESVSTVKEILYLGYVRKWGFRVSIICEPRTA